MAPKKKKQPKNAFYYFLLEFKEKADQNGENTNSSEIDIEADMAWRNLDPERRAHYENFAAERRRKVDNLENKFTTTGVSYAQLHREQMERTRQKEIMINEIESTVRALTSSTLRTKVFNFIHVNYYCRLLDGHFLPCEIGIAKFTFQDGVKDCYHTIINLECIPTGYFLECQKNSEETHQIPLPPENTLGERDDEKILDQIKLFLKENDSYPPVYTLQTNIEAAQDTLSTFAIGENLFRVYPISKLLFELRNACSFQNGSVGFPVESLAEREFEKDFFNLSPGISCDYHEGMDACQYCSLSIVKRWCYLFASLGCGDLGINLEEGSHRPRKVVPPPAPPEPMTSKNQVSHRKGKKGAPVVEPQPITIIDYSVKSSVDQKDYFNMPEVEASPLAQFGTYIRADASDSGVNGSKSNNNSYVRDWDKKKLVPPCKNNTRADIHSTSSKLKKYKASNPKDRDLPSLNGNDVSESSYANNPLKLSCSPASAENSVSYFSQIESKRSNCRSKNKLQVNNFPDLINSSRVMPQMTPKIAPLRQQTTDYYYDDPEPDLGLNMNESYATADIMRYENMSNFVEPYDAFVNDFRSNLSDSNNKQPLDDFDLYIEQTFSAVSEEERENARNVSVATSHMEAPYLSLRPPHGFDVNIGHGRGLTLERNLFSVGPGRENLRVHGALMRPQWEPPRQQAMGHTDVMTNPFYIRGRGRSRTLSYMRGQRTVL